MKGLYKGFKQKESCGSYYLVSNKDICLVSGQDICLEPEKEGFKD